MSTVNKYLAITLVVLFVLDSIVIKTTGTSIRAFTGLSASTFFGGQIWRLLTYPFVCNGLMEALFGGLILWFIGSDLEDLWGSKRYLSFLSASVIGGGVIFLLVGLLFSDSIVYQIPFSGIGGISGALCIAFGVLFPDRMMFFFFFPIKAKWFVILLIAMSLYQGVFSPGFVMAWGQLGAYASGFIWMIAVSNPRLKQMFQRSSSGGSRPTGRRKKNHLALVEDDNDDDDSGNITYH